MHKKLIAVAFVIILLSIAYALSAVAKFPGNGANRQTPSPALPQKHEDPVLIKVEEALSNEGPGKVIIADKNGKIIEKKDVQELFRQGYKSLREFADKKAGSDDCQKVSTKCVRCPDGKIYCSNDSKFLSGDKSKM